MPNELICYADSDVLFREGWFESSLEIIRSFPKVGMVSAQPTFHDVLDGKGTAHHTLVRDRNFTISEYRPPLEIVDEYCQGIGADDQLSANFREMDLSIISNMHTNMSAVLGATHMQFIIPREVARQMIPLPVSKALFGAETTSLDRKIDELGYLHLSTKKNYVMHMGNTISEKLKSEVQEINGSLNFVRNSDELILSRRSTLFRVVLRLTKYPRFNDFLLRVYDFLYRVLYVEK